MADGSQTSGSPLPDQAPATSPMLAGVLVGAVFACIVTILIYASVVGRRNLEPGRVAEQAQRQVMRGQAR